MPPRDRHGSIGAGSQGSTQGPIRPLLSRDGGRMGHRGGMGHVRDMDHLNLSQSGPVPRATTAAVLTRTTSDRFGRDSDSDGSATDPDESGNEPSQK